MSNQEKKYEYYIDIGGEKFGFDTVAEGNKYRTLYGTLDDPSKTPKGIYETYLKTGMVGNTPVLNGVGATYGSVDTSVPKVETPANVTNPNVNNVDTSIPATTDVYSPLYANAEAYKNNMYSRANSLRNASYAEATRAREEAERLAEVQRKRGIVDASTMAAQQRATYGANAEALGRSGLNVSGYSDYLNSQAYATGMAYRQAANAQATEANRQASYQEALARLEADKINAQSKAEADKTYYGLLNEIETAKIADAQQKQTNYQEFMKYALENGLDAESIKAIGSSVYGITDTNELNKVSEAVTSYANATGNIDQNASEFASNVSAGNLLEAAENVAGAEGYSANSTDGKRIKAEYLASIYSEYVDTDKGVDKAYLEKVNSLDDHEKEIYKNNLANNLSQLSFVDENGKAIKEEDAMKTVKSLLTFKENGLIDEKTVETLLNAYTSTYGSKFVNVNSETYDKNSFGKFASGEDQTKLLEDIVGMVEGKVLTSKGEKLKEGDEIVVNVGAGKQKSYEYLGNGLFKETKYSYSPNYVVPEDFVFDPYEKLKKTTGIIDVNEDSAAKKFGSYAGSTNENSEQSKYINKIIEAAKQGKIEKGQEVIANYGGLGLFTEDFVFKYIGDGKFIHTGKANVYSKDNVYVPDGYHIYTGKKDGRERIGKG